MPQVELEMTGTDWQQEAERLAVLDATGILDTPPEPAYDTVTRLAGEYFRPIRPPWALPMRAASG